MAMAFVFPGQGSQVVGMGKLIGDSYPEARSVFEEVDDALGEKLSDVIWNGPEDELVRTANAQPALMAVSLAVVRTLQAQGIDLASNAKFVAGHSLGEYSALAAAGCMTIGDTAKLLRIRGNAMQEAVPIGEGAMAALIGLDVPTSEKVAQEASQGDVCQVANDNAPGQVVISGHKSAILRAVDIAKEKGAKRAIQLPVSAPFHCDLMLPAQETMKSALADVKISDSAAPVICNVDSSPISGADEIRDALVRQVTGTVRWRESVELMEKSGIEKQVELGAGAVLTGLVRRISKNITGISINDPNGIVEFVNDQSN